MATNRHIIARQIFDLAIGSNLDGYVLQERISYIYWEKVAPSLADLFDRLADPDVLIRIDRLEIDLGEIDLSRLDSEFADRMIRVMGSHLTELLSKASGRVEQFPMAHSHFEAWLFFLEHGFLPWNSGGLPEKELHQAALETVAAESKAVARLRRLIRSQSQAAQRLVIQHPPSFLKLLAEAVSGQRQEKLALVAKEVQKLSEAFPPTASASGPDWKRPAPFQAGRVFWSAVVKCLAEERQPVLSFDLVQSAFAELTNKRPREANTTLAELMARQPAAFPELGKMLAALPGAILAPSADVADIREKEEPAEVGENAHTLPDSQIEAESKDELQSEPSLEIQKPESTGQEEKPEDISSNTENETPADEEQQAASPGTTEAEAPVPEKAKESAGDDLPQKDKEKEENISPGQDKKAPPAEPGEQQLDEVADRSEAESKVSGEDEERKSATEGGSKKPAPTSEHSEPELINGIPPTEPPHSAESPSIEGSAEKLPVAGPEEAPVAPKVEEHAEQEMPEQAVEKRQDKAAEMNRGENIREIPLPEGEERAPSTQEERAEESLPPKSRLPEEGKEPSPPEVADGTEPGIESPARPKKEQAKEQSKKSVEKPAPADEAAKAPEGPLGKEPPERHAPKKSELAESQDADIDRPEAESPPTEKKEEAPLIPLSDEIAPKEKRVVKKRKKSKETEAHKAAAEEERKQEKTAQKEAQGAPGELKKQQEELPSEEKAPSPPSEKEKRIAQAAEPEKEGAEEPEAPTTPDEGVKQKSSEAPPSDEGATEEQKPRKRLQKGSARKAKPEEDPPIGKSAEEPAPPRGADEPPGKEPKAKDKAKAPEKPERRATSAYSQPFAKQPEGTAYYIRNAGVVMVHAFLNTYFEAVGLVKQRQFVDEPSRHKAIHLIEYMAAGETGLPEYGLVLPKFLCSLPLEIPLEREVGIQKLDLEEADNLLGAVIKHWGAIGEASPAALREGFLRREGKLERRANGWYLVVEHKTMDVLLNRLPWNISMIQLPWMEEMLRVEWKS